MNIITIAFPTSAIIGYLHFLTLPSFLFPLLVVIHCNIIIVAIIIILPYATALFSLPSCLGETAVGQLVFQTLWKNGFIPMGQRTDCPF